jgi:valyl-tRNA synthetase
MFQQVHRALDESLPISVNHEPWPTPDKKLVDQKLEEDFESFFKYLSLTYSARQKAKLKRRWPLKKAVLTGPKNTLQAVVRLEDLFLELSNLKSIEYSERLDVGTREDKDSVLATENDLYVVVDTRRDQLLVGEGLMRDVARRVQALRKELGFTPTEILSEVHLAGFDEVNITLLEPHINSMAELVRTKKVKIHKEKGDFKADWRESNMGNKKMYIAIP